MRKITAAVALLVLSSACDGSDRLPVAPSTVSESQGSAPSPPPSVTTAQVIMVGEEVRDTLTFNGDDRLFELMAPSGGTLVARLSLDPGRLELNLAGRIFANFPDNLSPIVGELPVVAGERYRVRVADGAPWDYGGSFLPFILTIAIRE
jgi:hypothetical protein